MFTLAEEIFLLSLIERKEALRLPSSLSLPFALAGATIMDLVYSGVVNLQDGRLLLTDAAPSQTDPMKRVIERFQKVGKSKRVDFWVFQMGTRGTRVTKQILLSLVEKGFLQEDGKNLRWGVAVSAPGADDAQDLTVVKYLLKRNLRDAIFCQATLDERAAAITCLMNSCGMLNHLFTEDEMIMGRKRVNHLLKGEGLSSAYAVLLAQIITGIEYGVAAAISV